jgi:hypothetical protein
MVMFRYLHRLARIRLMVCRNNRYCRWVLLVLGFTWFFALMLFSMFPLFVYLVASTSTLGTARLVKNELYSNHGVPLEEHG